MPVSPRLESACARWSSLGKDHLQVKISTLSLAQAGILTVSNPGTLFRASQFLSEELPIRLAHRVQELGELPDGLNDMPSIKKVRDWYSQSFEVRKR